MEENAQSEKAPARASQQHVYQNYWGGGSAKNEPPMIHGKIKELRRAVGALEAKKQANGPTFAVKSSKELWMKLMPALDNLNLIVSVQDLDVVSIDPDKVPPTDRGKVVRSACTVRMRIRIQAEDGSYIESYGAGGGLDQDDKAVGKATTYAYKDAVLKVLTTAEKNMIDTDDEEDAGSAPKAPSTAEKDLLLKIMAAADKAALQALVPELKAQPGDAQLRLHKAFKARMTELS